MRFNKLVDYYERLKIYFGKKKELDTMKKSLHHSYYNDNKKYFIIFDILLILALLFNVGALFITNMLVVKENPSKVEFVESNPIQTKLNNFKPIEEKKTLTFKMSSAYKSFLIQSFLYTLIIFSYIRLRLNVISNDGFATLQLFVMLLLVLTGLDFINNAGFFVGLLIGG